MSCAQFSRAFRSICFSSCFLCTFVARTLRHTGVHALDVPLKHPADRPLFRPSAPCMHSHRHQLCITALTSPNYCVVLPMQLLCHQAGRTGAPEWRANAHPIQPSCCNNRHTSRPQAGCTRRSAAWGAGHPAHFHGAARAGAVR